jgi:hypothetical protein
VIIKNNIMPLAFVLSVSMLSHCSSSHTQQQANIPSSAPSWFSDPYDGSICNKVQHICQAAVGRTATQSDAMAKAELASYFGTQIQSQNTHSSTSKDAVSEEGQFTGSVGSEDRSSLSTTINGLLQVTEIVARNKNGTDHYALAQMNKKKAQQIIEAKIEKSKMSLKKLDKFQTRSAIALIRTQYQDLMDQALMLKLLDGDDRTREFENELSARIQSLEKMPAKKIQILGPNNPSENDEIGSLVVDALSQQVSDMGHEVVEDKDVTDMAGKISIKVSEVKSHSKIEGFEKWRVKINATYLEKTAQKGRLSLEQEFSGRSKAHIYDQLRPWLEGQLNNQLYLLNL